MTDTLLLADLLESCKTETHNIAAAELRRLHAINAELVEALENARICYANQYVGDNEKQADDLLEIDKAIAKAKQ